MILYVLQYTDTITSIPWPPQARFQADENPINSVDT